MQSLLRGYVLGMRTSVFCRSGEDDRDKKVKASVAAALLFTPIVYSDDLWLGYTGDLLQTGSRSVRHNLRNANAAGDIW